jgi:hypothetical protein
MPQRRTLTLLVLVAAGLLGSARAGATTWTAEATVSNERKTEVTAEGSDRTETFKQSYSLTYETDINPVLQFSIDLALDITDEIKEGPGDSDFDTREIKPSVDVELQAVWWDLTANWETARKTSDDPDQAKTQDDSWGLEFTAEPQGRVLPSGKIKFQRDTKIEGGDTQNRDDTLEGSLDYELWDLLDVTFDVKKDTQRNIGGEEVLFGDTVVAEIDRIQENRSYKFDVSLNKEFLENLKFEATWTNERQQTVEFADDSFLSLPEPIIKDEITSRDDTLKNNLKGKLTYVILRDLDLSLERSVEWNKDLEVDTLEVTDTWTGDAGYSRDLTETIGIDLSYGDERKRTRGTGSDSYGITRDYGAALDFSPLSNLSLSPSFDRTDKTEWFSNPEEETKTSVDDKWEVQLETSFWKDQVEFSASRSWNTTTEQGAKTTRKRNWDAEFTLAFEGVPNLDLSPKFTVREDRDLLASTTDTERKLEVGITYEIKLGSVTTFTVDHTYTRTSKDPADGESTIQRDDSSDLTLSFSDFFEGMSLELGLTRKAQDESKDDKGPVVDYTYNVTFDYDFLENYSYSFEYRLDKKDDGDDIRNFRNTFSMEFLKGLLTIDLEHEFEEQLQGDKKDSHRYLIEITGKF